MYGSPPPPQEINYSESMRDALQAQIDLAPDLYRAEMGQQKVKATQADVDAGLASKKGEEFYKDVGGSRLDYARMEQQIIGETLLGEGGGDAFNKSGAIGLLAGNNQTFVDEQGVTRRAGFDAQGNFMGTASLEEDLRQQQQNRQVANEIKLADENAQKLTDAIRTDGMDAAIASAKTLANEKSYKGGVNRPLSGTMDEFMSAKARVQGVNDPLKSDRIKADTNARDVNLGREAGFVSTDDSFSTVGAGGQGAVVSTNGNFERVGGAGNVRDANAGARAREVDAQSIGDLGGLRSGLQGQAMSDLALGGDLSAEERRTLEEASRSASMARGRLRDTASIVDEVASLEGARRERQNERRQFAQSVAGQEAGLAQADIQTDLQAQTLNQASDSEFASRGLAASQANINRDVSVAGIDQQAALANQQAGLASKDRMLQADLANQAENRATAERRQAADIANQQARESAKARSLSAQVSNQQTQLAMGARELESMQINQAKDLSQNQIGLQAQMAEADRMSQYNRDRLASQQVNQQKDLQLMNAQIAARNQDIDRGLQLEQINKDMQFRGLQADRAAAQNMVSMEQATSADPFMAITGRPSGQTTTVGQSTYGMGAAGVGAAPTLYNPAQGAEFMANQAAGINSYNAATYGAQQQAMAGIVGGVLSAGGAIGAAKIGACWVAREVYGENNPKWKLFRNWLLNLAPAWFRLIYLNYGERFATYISNKPKLKKWIRGWMDKRIKKLMEVKLKEAY